MPAKIDPKTGMPIELIKKSQAEAKRTVLEQDVKKGTEIIQALKSKAGLFFENQCKNILEKSIREFVERDPKCQGIMEILNAMGAEIKAAEYAAKLLEEKLRE